MLTFPVSAKAFLAKLGPDRTSGADLGPFHKKAGFDPRFWSKHPFARSGDNSLLMGGPRSSGLTFKRRVIHDVRPLSVAKGHKRTNRQTTSIKWLETTVSPPGFVSLQIIVLM
jgi:hypothetical protein